MNGMHFKIKSLVVDSMLRSSVEMELGGIPLGSCSKLGRCNLRSEQIWSLVESNFGGISNPENLLIFLICVSFCILILSFVISRVGIVCRVKIDWRLICEITIRIIIRPIVTILFVIIIPTGGTDYRSCKSCETDLFHI
jgi:hypothetical protein